MLAAKKIAGTNMKAWMRKGSTGASNNSNVKSVHFKRERLEADWSWLTVSGPIEKAPAKAYHRSKRRQTSSIPWPKAIEPWRKVRSEPQCGHYDELPRTGKNSQERS